jgi:hypothetical protein
MDTLNNTRQQPAPVSQPARGFNSPHIAAAAAGSIASTVTVIVMSLIHGQPDLVKLVITGVMNWGPAILILLVFAPPVIGAMRDQASALSDLSVSIRQHLEEQHGVRIAVSMLCAKFESFTAATTADIADLGKNVDAALTAVRGK